MSIDRSNASHTLGIPQRIGAIQRVDRDAPTKQYHDKNGRGKRDGRSDGLPPSLDVPQDIVDLSPGVTTNDDAGPPPPQRVVTSPSQEPERHLDIKV